MGPVGGSVSEGSSDRPLLASGQLKLADNRELDKWNGEPVG